MAPGVNSLNATYFANGTGRDTYISRDPVVHVGISERTPRPEIRNKPGITPRPPSSLDRGSKPMGYTGFLPGRPKGVGKSYSTLSEQQDTKNLIPPLVLKHRFVQPPGGQFSCVTSREYGSHFKNKDKKPEVANGAQVTVGWDGIRVEEMVRVGMLGSRVDSHAASRFSEGTQREGRGVKHRN